jgi:hypothetical protein
VESVKPQDIAALEAMKANYFEVADSTEANGTAAVVRTTATTASEAIGIALRRKSRGEVQKCCVEERRPMTRKGGDGISPRCGNAQLSPATSGGVNSGR